MCGELHLISGSLIHLVIEGSKDCVTWESVDVRDTKDLGNESFDPFECDGGKNEM